MRMTAELRSTWAKMLNKQLDNPNPILPGGNTPYMCLCMSIANVWPEKYAFGHTHWTRRKKQEQPEDDKWEWDTENVTYFVDEVGKLIVEHANDTEMSAALRKTFLEVEKVFNSMNKQWEFTPTYPGEPVLYEVCGDPNWLEPILSPRSGVYGAWVYKARILYDLGLVGSDAWVELLMMYNNGDSKLSLARHIMKKISVED